MSAETFGPSKKQTRSDLYFEDRREKFQEQFGFAPEEEVYVEGVPPETCWDADGSTSMWAQYYSRHPEARPKPAKPRELLKNMGPLVAPNTTAGQILEKLIAEFRAGVERYKELQSKLQALEAKVDPNPCADKGPNYRMIDSECVEVAPHILDSPPAPPVPAGMSKDSEIVDSVMNKVVRKEKLFTKKIPLDASG